MGQSAVTLMGLADFVPEYATHSLSEDAYRALRCRHRRIPDAAPYRRLALSFTRLGIAFTTRRFAFCLCRFKWPLASRRSSARAMPAQLLLTRRLEATNAVSRSRAIGAYFSHDGAGQLKLSTEHAWCRFRQLPPSRFATTVAKSRS